VLTPTVIRVIETVTVLRNATEHARDALHRRYFEARFICVAIALRIARRM
jgi:hypothetical protein